MQQEELNALQSLIYLRKEITDIPELKPARDKLDELIIKSINAIETEEVK